jgi:hypothetical protein
MTGKRYWNKEAIMLLLKAAEMFGYATNWERTQAIKTYPPLVEFLKNDVGIWDEDVIGVRIIEKLRQVHPKGNKNPEKDGRNVKRRVMSTIKPMQSTPSFVTPTESSDREAPIRKSLFESTGKKFEKTPLPLSSSPKTISVTKRSHEKISHEKNIEIPWPERLTHGYFFLHFLILGLLVSFQSSRE